MDLLTQTSLFLAVLSLGLGISVLARNYRDKLHSAFAWRCLSIFFGALFYVLARTLGGRLSYDLHLLFNLWIVPAGLLVARYLVPDKAPANSPLLFLSLGLAPPLSLGLLFGIQNRAGVLSGIYFFPVILSVQMILMLFQELRDMKARPVRPVELFLTVQKKLWIYGGGLAILMTCTMDHVPEAGQVWPSLGNMALCVYLFFLSQVVTQQRFLNIGMLGARFVVIFILAWILTGLYLLVVAWVQDSFGLFLLNSFIVSFLVVTLLNPMQTMVRFFTRSLMSPQIRRFDQAIRIAERQLARITDEKLLYDQLLKTFQQLLEPRYIAVYGLRVERARYERVRFQGTSEDAFPEQVLSQHPLLTESQDRLVAGKTPFLLVEDLQGEVDRSTRQMERENLRIVVELIQGLGGNLFIPLVDTRKTVGFVIFKVDQPPREWGDSWFFLSSVFSYGRLAAKALMATESFTKEKDRDRLAVLGQMAAGLAHEIRNPLGAIKGAAQYLDPSRNTPESRFLQVIVEEVDRLNRVVTQFLDYSRPNVLNEADFDLSLCAHHATEFAKPGLPANLEIEYALSQPVWVRGEADQLRQVILNLLQNAAKALLEAEISTPKIILRTGVDGHMAWLTVRDNGPGIRPADQDKVFIPFFTTSPSGTGLGLSISQKIIETHGGKITFSSEARQGTEFRIELPAKESKT